MFDQNRFIRSVAIMYDTQIQDQTPNITNSLGLKGFTLTLESLYE